MWPKIASFDLYRSVNQIYLLFQFRKLVKSIFLSIQDERHDAVGVISRSSPVDSGAARPPSIFISAAPDSPLIKEADDDASGRIVLLYWDNPGPSRRRERQVAIIGNGWDASMILHVPLSWPPQRGGWLSEDKEAKGGKSPSYYVPVGCARQATMLPFHDCGDKEGDGDASMAVHVPLPWPLQLCRGSSPIFTIFQTELTTTKPGD